MAISDKLTYLNGTKLQLKDMINYGLDTGEKITSETTFRNYVRSLFDAFIKAMTYPDVLYENLPKVTGTGTSVTLNGTAEAPMRNTLSPSAISQDGEPSPSNPQDIHTVSGNNEIKIQNNNLFTGDYSQFDSQGGVGSTYGYFKLPDDNEPYTLTLTAKETFTTTRQIYLGFSNEGGSSSGGVLWAINYNANQTVNKGYTVSRTSSVLRYISLYGNSRNVLKEITDHFEVQLEKGSTASNFEPHKEQTYPISLGDLEYCKIGDYEDVFFKNVQGSTYYDSTLELNKWYLKKNIGKIVFDGTENITIRSSTSSRIAYNFVRNDIILYSDSTVVPYFKTTKFITVPQNETWVPGTISASTNANKTVIFILESNSTIEQLKEIINGEPLYYVLATPTFTLLSDTLQTQLENIYKAMSYDGQTNVSQENNDLPFVLSLSAIRDLSGIFE